MVANIGTKTFPDKTLRILMRLLCMASLAQVTEGADVSGDQGVWRWTRPYFWAECTGAVLMGIMLLMLLIEMADRL